MELNYAVITGNPVDGLILYGPFEGAEAANEWAAVELKHEEWWVTRLESP